MGGGRPVIPLTGALSYAAFQGILMVTVDFFINSFFKLTFDGYILLSSCLGPSELLDMADSET